MAKILLVEDDSNLREIYGARLDAEGYEIIAAADGEEALALAVRERPDLIISDVMMPKISGFDMLDIIRTTPETKNVKVIVMTALSQEEDRLRGEQLGADKYVVKSQVTLDDIVSMVNELLNVTGSSSQPSIQQNYSQDSTSSQANNNPSATSTQTANQRQVDPNSLNQEIQQFVASSPLMNPEANKESQPLSSEQPQQQDQTTSPQS